MEPERIGLFAAIGAVLGVGRVWQKVEAHEERMKDFVPRTEFELMGKQIDEIHQDVREIRRSLQGERYNG